MVAAHHHHRPTLKQVRFDFFILSVDEVLPVILAQQNKRFKSKHATKSSLKDAAKGLYVLLVVLQPNYCLLLPFDGMIDASPSW
jgi:hypothetical protein